MSSGNLLLTWLLEKLPFIRNNCPLVGGEGRGVSYVNTHG